MRTSRKPNAGLANVINTKKTEELKDPEVVEIDNQSLKSEENKTKRRSKKIF
ncbi:MAG: hypothetical protein ACOC1O_03550 [bacterium]